MTEPIIKIDNKYFIRKPHNGNLCGDCYFFIKDIPCSAEHCSKETYLQEVNPIVQLLREL
jgi:hypothetical protein